MKTTTYFIFILGLCLFFCSCSKDNESNEPTPEPTKVKYLAKIMMVSANGEERLWESYTWNTQNQLIQVDMFGSETTYRFTYGINNNIDSIYFSYGRINTEKYAGKFYYDEFNRINKMEFRHDDNQVQLNYLEYNYNGNNKLLNVTLTLIHKKQEASHISFDWNGNNISREIDGIYGSTTTYNDYDSLVNPFGFFPKIVLLGMAESAYCAYSFFIASENNYLLADYYGKNYEYKYDADGYPILSYMKENGEWKEFKKYEYLPE